MNKKYTAMWIIWLLGFGVIEYAAMKNNKSGDTLTEHVWKVIGTNTPGRNWENWVARVVLAGLLIWLVPHFFTGSI